jgi:hypothetical protein
MDSGRNRANSGLFRPPARHRRRTVGSKRNTSGQEFKVSRPARCPLKDCGVQERIAGSTGRRGDGEDIADPGRRCAIVSSSWCGVCEPWRLNGRVRYVNNRYNLRGNDIITAMKSHRHR